MEAALRFEPAESVPMPAWVGYTLAAGVMQQKAFLCRRGLDGSWAGLMQQRALSYAGVGWMNVSWMNAAGLVASEMHGAHASSEPVMEAAAEQAVSADAAARPQDRWHFENQNQPDCHLDLEWRRS